MNEKKICKEQTQKKITKKIITIKIIKKIPPPFKSKKQPIFLLLP